LTGEICARGYSIMKGYFDNPAATASAIDSERWLHTGDLGSLDEHGYCRIQGRLKDMIIRGEENIYPREVEDVLYAHPQILDASVVGVPDHVWGKAPIAFVQLKPGHQSGAQELTDFCRRSWRHIKFREPGVLLNNSRKLHRERFRNSWYATPISVTKQCPSNGMSEGNLGPGHLPQFR
jgi:acyl-CoA synthetase (AMP-forming)/AMP-acid ligase II